MIAEHWFNFFKSTSKDMSKGEIPEKGSEFLQSEDHSH